MDLQQTWAQVQELPLADQHTILENLLHTLPPPPDWQFGTKDELHAELERRVDEDIANPEGACTFEEYLAKRAANK